MDKILIFRRKLHFTSEKFIFIEEKSNGFHFFLKKISNEFHFLQKNLTNSIKFPCIKSANQVYSVIINLHIPLVIRCDVENVCVLNQN